jgi:ATP-dependent protease ClpP protease subunit
LPLSSFAATEQIKLTSNNTVVYRGEVNGRSAIEAQLDLAKLVIKRGTIDYPLYLVLDSPGGSIEAGFMFIQFAKLVPNLHTISIFAASMASAIVEQLPGRRLVTENGTLMFHQAYAGLEGTVEVGSLETTLYYVKRRVRSLEQANANRMQMSLTDYKGLVSKELWLDAQDSIRFRAADNIVDIVCSQELIMKMNTVSMQSIFGAITFKFSGCPLFRAPVDVSDARVQYKLPSIGKKQE